MNSSESKLVQDLRDKKQSELKEENKLLADLNEKKVDNNTDHLLPNSTNMSISKLLELLSSTELTEETKQFFDEYINSLVSNPEK